MNTAKLVTPDMPDIANRTLQSAQAKLDWVGMSNVHQPLRVKDGNQSKEVHANIQVYVNLADPLAKGIHMSRLYLILDEHAATRPLTAAGLKMLLGSVLESHHDLSTNAFVQFEFDHFVRRPALLSDNVGWASSLVPFLYTISTLLFSAPRIPFTVPRSKLTTPWMDWQSVRGTAP